MWIVKLGGSLALAPALRPWLRLIAEEGAGRVVVVPGGGRFADAVRAAQAHWRFDDPAAHNMAVLAMAQTATMLHALEPRLRLEHDDGAIREALRQGRAAVWMPLGAMRQTPDPLTSWDVTSDSLALWLARRLGAERLLLVKACRIDHAASLDALSAAGVVDRRFPAWAAEAAIPIEWFEQNEVDRARAALRAARATPRG